MDKEQALLELETLPVDDAELAHPRADEILLEYLRNNGDSDIAAAWEAVNDACGGFWYA